MFFKGRLRQSLPGIFFLLCYFALLLFQPFIQELPGNTYLKEGVDPVLCVQAGEDPGAVKHVEDEGPEDVPTPQLVDDLHQGLVVVRLDVVQGHARAVKVVHL